MHRVILGAILVVILACAKVGMGKKRAESSCSPWVA